MSLLNLTNFNLVAGGQTLLQKANLDVQAGDKIGLIGPNGSGKTTLLKHLAKFDNCYYLSQEIFATDQTTLQFLEAKLENYWQIETVLEQYFGYNFLDYDKNLNQYSGGQLMQIFLSLTILSQAEVLLLDEPTNHLDKSSQQILSNFLQNLEPSKAFILVCHNLSFLNENVTQIWNLEDQKVAVYGGNYDFFVAQKDLELKAKARNFVVAKKQKTILEENQHNLLLGVGKSLEKVKKVQRARGQGESFDKFELHFLKNGAQKGAAKSNLDFDQKIEAEKLKMQNLQTFKKPKIQFEFFQKTKAGSTLLSLENFDLYSLGGDLLIQKCNLQLKAGQKIGLTGNNGSGKTTLIKTLTQGKIFETKTAKLVAKLWRNDNFHYQILAQNYQEILDLELTLEQNLAKLTDLSSSQIRRQLANFLFFTSAQVSQKANSLSGGEKARLALAILTASNCDLLILDEPTNNLDVPSLEFFVQALTAYPGALLVISHDQAFLDKLCLDCQYEIVKQKLVLKS